MAATISGLLATAEADTLAQAEADAIAQAAAEADAKQIALEAKEVDTSDTAAAPDRVKRAEAVLRLRTDRVAVVLECPASVSCNARQQLLCIFVTALNLQDMNQQAVLRTAEALGIQTVYVVCTPEERKKKLSKGMAELLYVLPQRGN